MPEDLLNIDDLLDFAEDTLCDVASIWNQSDSEQKRRLQGVLFPQGVSFATGEFGTATTSLFFNYLAGVQSAGENVASPTGSELVCTTVPATSVTGVATRYAA